MFTIDMTRKILATLTAVLACCVVLASSPTRAGEIEADGVRLPADIKIDTNQALPAHLKKFLGAWIGQWGDDHPDALKHILIVERIDAKGRAKVVYAWGDSRVHPIRKGFSRFEAVVKDNRLIVNDGLAEYRYDLPAMTARYSGDGSTAKMWPLPMSLVQRKKQPLPWRGAVAEAFYGPALEPCGPWSRTGIEVDGVPLPNDIHITSAESVQAAFRKYLGVWSGNYGDASPTPLKSVVVVEGVDPQGRADLIFALGDSAEYKIEKGYARCKAIVEKDRLRILGVFTDLRSVNDQFLQAIYMEGVDTATLHHIDPPAANTTDGASLPKEASAADADEPEQPSELRLRLLKAESKGKSCSLMFDVYNGLPQQLKRAEFEIYLLSSTSEFLSDHTLQLPPLPSGSKKRIAFKIPSQCDVVAHIVFNGFTLCRGDGDLLAECSSKIAVSSGASIAFDDDVDADQ